jgi:hypothetical protein
MAMGPSTLSEWRLLKKQLTREGFVARFPHPFLIWEHIEADTEQGIGFRTNVGSIDGSHDGGGSLDLLEDATILPVTKKPENPYPDRISVGRTGNCDVVLRDASVSKLHAQLVLKPAGRAEVLDRGSANGTRLNGKLVAGEGTIVSPGDSLAFGGVIVSFVDALRLWQVL